MTTRQLLQLARAHLQGAGVDSARVDADVLLMHCWNKSRTELILLSASTVPEAVQQSFHELILRRCQHEPVAYLTGHKEFWSLDFLVNSSVLIPRPETEHLIETVLRMCPDKLFPWRFCEIGTGSGCIAITLASEFPRAQIVATDISADALVTARINAEIHQLAERISFQQGHLLDALPANEQPFHLIVSNPPYVSAVEMDSLEIDLSFEPRSALTDEADGMSLIREMLESSPRWLYSKGSLIVETGPCGLPPSPLAFANPVTYADLAEKLRGGIYTLKS